MLKILGSLFWIISSFEEKIFYIPTIYFALIVYLLDYIIHYINRKKLNNKTKIFINLKITIFFIILLLISIHTLLISTAIVNSFIYISSLIFFSILSLFVLRSMKNDKELEIFREVSFNYFSTFTFLSLILLPVNIFILDERPANYLAYMSDPNLVAFINIFMLSIFILNRKRTLSIVIYFFGIFSESRTFLLMSTIFLFSFFFFNDFKNIITYLSIKLKSIKIVILTFLFFTSLLIINPRLGSDTLIDNLKNGIEVSKVIYFGEEFSFFTPDKERVFLQKSNTDLLKETWPKPLGLGLKNYQNKLSKYANKYFVRPAKTHNFYISYAIEYGYMFPFILFIMLISVKKIFSNNSQNRAFSSLALSFIFGLFFNEFFYCPLVLLTFLY